MIMSDAWASVFRIVVGTYWLYFASQKWQGVGWMQGVIKSTAQSNPIPGLHKFLNGVAVPNWFVFAGAQAIGETLVADPLILGLATRWAAVLGLLRALKLAATAACGANDNGSSWTHYRALTANHQATVSGGA